MENLMGTDYVIEIDTITSVATNTRGTEANYKTVACWTTNGFEVSLAEQATSNKCDEGWSTSQSGLGSWTLTGDGQAVSLTDDEKLVKANYQTLLKLAIDKKIFFARLTNPTKGLVREGKVRFSQYNETAPNGEAYTFTATMVGIGKPEIEPAVVTP